MANNFYFMLGYLCMLLCIPLSTCSISNNRPIIGIIAQDPYPLSRQAQYGDSLILASYVKFVETGGARVVPIMINKSQEYYENIMSKINGVLFPGGGAPLDGDGYGRTGRIIYEIAVKLNDKNDYFPLWGTCLGFELLNYLSAGQRDWMKDCESYDQPSNLNFVIDTQTSKLFRNLDNELRNVIQSENVTINYHHSCYTPQNFTKSGLIRVMKTLSLNRDLNNLTYISSVESFRYPFYGVAFHPEKVLFEWELHKSEKNIPHTSNAVRVSQYFANFFISEARKNNHRFPSKVDEDEVLIYNFHPRYTGKENMTVEQVYYFN